MAWEAGFDSGGAYGTDYGAGGGFNLGSNDDAGLLWNPNFGYGGLDDGGDIGFGLGNLNWLPSGLFMGGQYFNLRMNPDGSFFLEPLAIMLGGTPTYSPDSPGTPGIDLPYLPGFGGDNNWIDNYAGPGSDADFGDGSGQGDLYGTSPGLDTGGQHFNLVMNPDGSFSVVRTQGVYASGLNDPNPNNNVVIESWPAPVVAGSVTYGDQSLGGDLGDVYWTESGAIINGQYFNLILTPNDGKISLDNGKFSLEPQPWNSVDSNQRIQYVMDLLVNKYHFDEIVAAGIVGNLIEESNLIPNKIETAKDNAPMKAEDVNGNIDTFSAQQIMDRVYKENGQHNHGPRKPGVGLLQWTFPAFRRGLFQHNYQGKVLGSDILYNMDAQVDYLVSQLRTLQEFRGLYNDIVNSNSLNSVSDDIAYDFARPGRIFDKNKEKLPRSDPSVQSVFANRREASTNALNIYRYSQHLY